MIAGIGSSATNDGGAGMAQALGYRLLDAAGSDLPRGGAALLDLDRIDAAGLDPAMAFGQGDGGVRRDEPSDRSRGREPRLRAAERVPIPKRSRLLDKALWRTSRVVIERDLGKRVADIPGAGAAGGTGAGLMAFLDARLVSGAALVVDASGFDRALPGADLVITGEGRVDGQTAYGKAPGEVARRAQAAGVPTLLIAGGQGRGLGHR